MVSNRETTLAALLVAIMLTAGFAGCIGSNTDSIPEPGDLEAQGSDEARTEGVDMPGNTSREVDYAAGNETLKTWANGTFAPHEACFTGGCVTGQAMHAADITDIIPPNAPVNLVIDIEYTAPPGWAPMSAWVDTSETSFYSYSASFQPGEAHLDIVLTRGDRGTVEAITQLILPSPSTESPQTEYTLEATASPISQTVYAGMPVEVPLEPGQNITAHISDGDEIAFRVYDPDDEAIDHVEADAESTTWQVPLDRPAGAYVLANTWTSRLTLESENEGPMRALITDFTLSEPTSFEGTGTEDWSFDVREDPLWAGIYVRDTDREMPLGFPMSGPGATVSGFDATLTFPDEDTTEGSWTCVICINSGFYTSFGPPFADPGLVAGTYEAQISSDGSMNYEYGHAVGTYVR